MLDIAVTAEVVQHAISANDGNADFNKDIVMADVCNEAATSEHFNVSEALVVNGATAFGEPGHTMDEDSVIFKQRCAA